MRFLNFKNISFSKFWIPNLLALVIISFVVNHLSQQENFPFSDNYTFPWISMLISMFIGSIILIIAYFNFQFYKTTYFTTKINVSLLLRFLLTTLGYVTIIYIPIYIIIIGLVDGTNSYSLYYGLTGLSITLLLSTIGITASFSNEIYQLHKVATISGKLKVQQGGKITMVSVSDISFLFSESKVVYLVKIDGTLITTDFTLNDIETKMNEYHFFRANRQTILHPRSIEQVTFIENGKLSVLLKPSFSDKKASQITISRYKKQAFINWFESKL